jgi:ribosomal protein L32
MKHDWSIIKLGAVLCSKCQIVKMPHTVDAECKGKP